MWKPAIIKGNLSLDYEASDDGFIRYSKTKELKKSYLNTNGYVFITLTKRVYGVTSYRIHRIIAETFIPNPNNLPYVNHIDGNKTNNSVSNLEWCTAKENTQHAEKNHLVNHARGENSGAAVYTNEDIREVCELLEKGFKCTEIAKMTKVSREMINSIRLGDNWTHISCEYNFKKGRIKPNYKKYHKKIDQMIKDKKSRKDMINIMKMVLDKKVAKILVDGRLFAFRKKQSKRLKKIIK